jgi:hypothetical protein
MAKQNRLHLEHSSIEKLREQIVSTEPKKQQEKERLKRTLFAHIETLQRTLQDELKKQIPDMNQEQVAADLINACREFHRIFGSTLPPDFVDKRREVIKAIGDTMKAEALLVDIENTIEDAAGIILMSSSPKHTEQQGVHILPRPETKRRGRKPKKS